MREEAAVDYLCPVRRDAIFGNYVLKPVPMDLPAEAAR